MNQAPQDLRRTTRVSIVSHGQGALVHALLQDLATHERAHDIEIVLTINLPETLPFSEQEFAFPLHLVRNERPKGFGANHNAAFRFGEAASRPDYFCVVNPDIRLRQPVLDSLRKALGESDDNALVAPRVVTAEGTTEDSARPLPTPFAILGKAMRFALRRPSRVSGAPASPDWVAGMFMLFRSGAFAALGGFNERFHLYYEDVDICCRLRLAGKGLRLDRSVAVEHDARRTSHRNLRYLRWHLGSMMRFFTSRVFLKCWLLK